MQNSLLITIEKLMSEFQANIISHFRLCITIEICRDDFLLSSKSFCNLSTNEYICRMLFAHIFTTLNRPMRRRACAWLFLPSRRWQRQTGPSQEKLKQSLIHYLFWEKKEDERNKMKEQSVLSIAHRSSSISLFYNARSALYHGIRALGIGWWDEIILQAYTCVSVPNAIIATGARPMYCDIDPDTLNIDPTKIIPLITPRTKAILIQHTFGISADIKAIQKICTDHNLILIEDVCHALGAEYQWQKLGTFGDIAIFSFGRDKIVSSVNGGALLINLNARHCEEQSNPWYFTSFKMTQLPKKTIIQNLLYIILWQLCKISYRFWIGKFLYYLSGTYHLFPTIVTSDEKACRYTDFDYMMPHCLADIAYRELKRIDEYNAIRTRNTQLYQHLLPEKNIKGWLLRCLMLSNDIVWLAQTLKSKGILLWDRYQQVIAPRGTDYAQAGYIAWSCPIAESLASQSINLPNHPEIREQDVSTIVSALG